MPIRVLVVDDSIVFRTKLQLSLSEDPEIQVVACAIDAADALKKIRTFSPDVVTLDVEMPNVNGIDFLKDLIPKHPIPVVVVSALPLNALDALSAGAVDFVRKPMAGRPNTGKLLIEDLKAKVKIS
ncbi:MAG: response regulator [Evtepia sp.]